MNHDHRQLLLSASPAAVDQALTTRLERASLQSHRDHGAPFVAPELAALA